MSVMSTVVAIAGAVVVCMSWGVLRYNYIDKIDDNLVRMTLDLGPPIVASMFGNYFLSIPGSLATVYNIDRYLGKDCQESVIARCAIALMLYSLLMYKWQDKKFYGVATTFTLVQFIISIFGQGQFRKMADVIDYENNILWVISIALLTPIYHPAYVENLIDFSSRYVMPLISLSIMLKNGFANSYDHRWSNKEIMWNLAYLGHLCVYYLLGHDERYVGTLVVVWVVNKMVELNVPSVAYLLFLMGVGMALTQYGSKMIA